MAPSQGSRAIVFLLVGLAVEEAVDLAALAAAWAIGCPAHSRSHRPSVDVFNSVSIIIKALFGDIELLRDAGRRQAGSWFSQVFFACGHAADGHPGIFYGHKPGSGRDCTI